MRYRVSDERTKREAINDKAMGILKQRSTRQLLSLWEMTTTNDSPYIPTVRGWIMDELASRFPVAFDAWLDSDTDDAALREYVLG